jgi:hypothetical protein
MFENVLLSSPSPGFRGRLALPLSVAIHVAAPLGLLGAAVWREGQVPDPAIPIVFQVPHGPPPPPPDVP